MQLSTDKVGSDSLVGSSHSVYGTLDQTPNHIQFVTLSCVVIWLTLQQLSEEQMGQLAQQLWHDGRFCHKPHDNLSLRLEHLDIRFYFFFHYNHPHLRGRHYLFINVDHRSHYHVDEGKIYVVSHHVQDYFDHEHDQGEDQLPIIIKDQLHVVVEEH